MVSKYVVGRRVSVMQKIPVAIPLLGEEEAAAAREVILSGWVTQGPKVAAFEKAFSDYTGAKHSCAVSSCTTALHLALLTAGVEAGDEVVTVSWSFIATANAVTYCGATPVFVDVESDTYNIDPQKVKEAITPKTKAILCVHQFGTPCNLIALKEIANAANIPLIEDAACAIGSEIKIDEKWQKIGKPVGDIACFSFHPRKIITTGDGGMLTTDNEDYDARFRLLRQHYMNVPDTVRHNASEIVFEEYPEVGYNYRLTDIQAAIGIEQMKRLPAIIAERRKLAGIYFEMLSGVAGITLPIEAEYVRTNWQTFMVVLAGEYNQKEVMQLLLDKGISTRRGIPCAHKEQAYSAVNQSLSLPASVMLQTRGLILPLFPGMTKEDVAFVTESLVGALSQ